MNIKSLCYLTLLLFLFNSCEDKRAESIRNAREEIAKYEASFPEAYKEVIRKYKAKEIPIIEKTIKIKGGVFWLVNGIYSLKSFNDKLSKEGYCVTLNQDSLSYFIFTESIPHNVGHYTNGGKATRVEKSLIALDVSNEVAYILKKDIGGMPPSSISRNRGSDVGATGRYMTDDDAYHFIVSKILVKP